MRCPEKKKNYSEYIVIASSRRLRRLNYFFCKFTMSHVQHGHIVSYRRYCIPNEVNTGENTTFSGTTTKQEYSGYSGLFNMMITTSFNMSAAWHMDVSLQDTQAHERSSSTQLCARLMVGSQYTISVEYMQLY